MMIITGIFLFALGTKLGSASPTKTEVKYEGPNKITIFEDTGKEQLPLPGAMPPYGPNFIHQGSNFVFHPPSPLPLPIIPPVVETIVPTLETRNCEKIDIITDQGVEVIVEEKPAVPHVIEVEPLEILPLPEVPIVINEFIEPIPQEVEIDIIENPVIIPMVPELPSLVLPEIPFPIVPQVTIPILPEVNIPSPVFIEEPVRIIASEIPPPPELPPLVLSEKPRPVFIEEKKVILVPALPEIPAFLPPQVIIGGKPIIPTTCAQNIVLERILPHIMYEKTQQIELISFPAARSVPVVNYPYINLK